MKQKTIVLIMFFVLLALCSAHTFAQEQQMGGYTGIMLFLAERRDVIIVAPTLSDERKEAGMKSCERKKAFLEKFMGTEAVIVEDKNLTQEDKGKDLIIVGKDNALLKEIWKMTPLRVTPDNFFFLQEEFDHPRDHAIFFQTSPFDESKRILVCTSIFPDIDKIRPFPFSGSDWIVMRDVTYLKQGRFYAGSSLPPRSDHMASFDHREILNKYSSESAHVESPLYEISYPAKLMTQEKIKTALKKREDALYAILKDHNLKPLKKKMKIFCYKNKDEKQENTAVPDPVHFFGQTKEVHMIQDVLLANNFHEDAHIVAELILSDDASAHITEGFAIYIDGKWKGEDLDFVSGFYLKMDKIPPMADLLDEAQFSKLPTDLSFPLIGSITKFIIDQYGMDKFQKLLNQRQIDDSALKNALGLDLNQFQQKWKEDVKRKSAAFAKKISFTKHNISAQEFTAQKDFQAAAKELLKALEFIPDDPQALFNLASCYMRIPKLQEAEKVLLKILSMKLPESELRFVIFGHYQLAKVYDLMGKREKALSEYKKVLEFPDMFDSHNLATEGLAVPATLEDFDRKE
jgi:hypothetical protein